MSELVEVCGIDCLVSVSTEIPFRLFYFLVSTKGTDTIIPERIPSLQERPTWHEVA